jgi:hypothetical protein
MGFSPGFSLLQLQNALFSTLFSRAISATPRECFRAQRGLFQPSKSQCHRLQQNTGPRHQLTRFERPSSQRLYLGRSLPPRRKPAPDKAKNNPQIFFRQNASKNRMSSPRPIHQSSNSNHTNTLAAKIKMAISYVPFSKLELED